MSILPIISYSHLTLGQELAKTAHADVHLSTWQREQVVIKEFRLSRMTAEGQAEFVKEAQITAQLSHPHVVRLFGICNEPSHYCLVIEYVAKGALQTLLASAEPLTWKTRLQIGCDMTSGLAYLHEQKVLHQDMKSGNVLIDGTYRAKLTGFNQTKVKDEVLKNRLARGTLAWSPPELFDDPPIYSEKTDIYALGMTLWELASRQIPYAGLTELAVMRKIDRGEYPAIPADTLPLLTPLIQACWVKDPAQRPLAPKVLEALDKIPLPSDSSSIHLAKPSQVAERGAPKSAIATSSSSKPACVPAPSIPTIAFGVAQWKTYFGDVGAEPPLPTNIHEILKAPCPFWAGKTVEETHLLTLIPAQVNGKSFCLDQLRELIKHPKQGPATDYREYSDYIKAEDKQRAPQAAYWVLLTRDVLPDTRHKRFLNQEKKVKGKKYDIPGILELATGVLMEHVRSGKRLYGDAPWTWTRGQESDATYGDHYVIGGFTASGISISSYDDEHRDEQFGAGARLKL